MTTPDNESTSPGRTAMRSRWVPALFAMIALPATVVLVVWFAEGRLIAEKTLTRLVQPSGALWCVLFALIWFAWTKRANSVAFAILIVWLGYTIAGNSWVTSRLTYSLEEPYMSQRPYEEEHFDAIALLGGGAWIGPTKELQLARAGDRVMTATRMYHLGLTDKVICTGGYVDPDPAPDKPSIAEISAKLLTDAGVPQEDIILLEGRNTKEELALLKEWYEQAQDKPRMGVITSAWHMRRVMLQAERNELEIVPLPCHFITAMEFDTRVIIPSSESLETTAAVLHEYLGAAIGR